MATLDRSRVAARMRRSLGTNGTTRGTRAVVPSAAMTRTAVLLAIAATAVAAPAMAATAGSGTTTTAEPRVPATVNATSPFTADRPSSEPLGLFPNQATDPFTYPDEPVVLGWSPVPGAVHYVVEISNSPGFTSVLWSLTTDQIEATPNVLLPDGSYWWRVTAVDKAGTKGIVSKVATFAKEWPNAVTGGVLSTTPGGAAADTVRITPYMRWSEVAGAAYYETQIAAADQFATPAFLSLNFPNTFMSPAELGALPDDSYHWRVRATDAAKNPGPWVDMGAFTKQWVAPTVTGPADAASTYSLNLRWEPVPGAESYQVQISDRQYVWQGDRLELDTKTASTALVPSLEEEDARSIVFEDHWWRVRPVVAGVYGTWSAARKVTWRSATSGERTSMPVLTTAADSNNALTPQMVWTPVPGAHIYRVDVATDPNFNHIVETATTSSTAWAVRSPLPDNQVREGYFWRVVAGAGLSVNDPQWLYDEVDAPVSRFSKQTQVTLGSAASGVITEPPLFTWSDVLGAARYELQLSRDEEFDVSRTQSVKIYGLGTAWTKDQAKRLPSGTWYWRVRAIDAAEKGQTWSPVGHFTVNPPRPTISGPDDGATVVGSPVLRWAAMNGSCGYQAQIADNPSFQGADDTTSVSSGGDATITPGAPAGKPVDAADALTTPQTALIPSGAVVTKPGVWYWRVRTIFCADSDYSPWSVTRSFHSVLSPKFNLNKIPTKVAFGRNLVVAGRLTQNGTGVSKPSILVERRVSGSSDFTTYGTITGDVSGRFSFHVGIDRTATWRLRWAKSDAHPEGIAPFVVRAVPRLSFTLATAKAVRGSRVTARGSIYPRRTAYIQVLQSDGWKNLSKITGKTRFSVKVKADLAPGSQRLRLYVPDGDGSLQATGSTTRRLFVYDRFVVKGGG